MFCVRHSSFFLFLHFSIFIVALPQRRINSNCPPGQSLVSLENCKNDGTTVDLRQAGLQDMQGICCKDSDIISHDYLENATSECGEFEERVKSEKCKKDIGAVIQPRSGRPDFVCCNEADVIRVIESEQSGTEKDCEKDQDFRCVPAESCNTVVLAQRGGDDFLKVFAGENNIQQLEINSTFNKCSKDLEVCCRVDKSTGDFEMTSHIPPQQVDFACGQHNKNGIRARFTESIEGRGATQFGEWPNMCVLYRGDQNRYLGGASLIAPGVVLTAAHKVYKLEASELTVRCGEWDIFGISEPLPHQNRKVQKIIFHPSFKLDVTRNNFALLFTEEEFQLREHIGTICLPDQPNDGSEFDPNNCVSMGWGKDKFGEKGNYQQNLKQVKLKLVKHGNCQAILRRSNRIADDFVLDPTLVCANGTEDTCTGDGGGPLMCKARDSERWIQVGIVSWGLGCNNEYPGVYASIPNGLCFVDWATKCVADNKYNDFFNIQGCQNWLDNELEKLGEKKRILETRKLAGLTSAQRRVTETDLEHVKISIKRAEGLLSSCVTFSPRIFDFS